MVLSFVGRTQISNTVEARRVTATVALQDVHSQLVDQLFKTLRSARMIAKKMSGDAHHSQAAFETAVTATLGEEAQLVLAELAPGYVTKFVYPRVGNERFLGQHPIASPSSPPDATGYSLNRDSPVTTAFRLDEHGKGTFQAIGEVRLPDGQGFRVTGLVRLVVDFALHLPDRLLADDLGEIETLYLVHRNGSPEIAIPTEWDPNGPSSPALVTTQFPWGTFTTLLRPKQGWALSAAEGAKLWSWLIVAGLLLLIPIILANRFAISYAVARVDLSQTKDRLENVLEDLQGAALTVTWPPGATKESDEDKAQFLNRRACFAVWGVEASDVENDINVLRACNENRSENEGINQAILKSARTLQPWNAVWPIRTPAGERRWLEGHGHPTRLPDGSLRWASIVFDSTKLVEHKRELERQRSHFANSQRLESLGRLTGGVAHDFNNLMAVVLGNLEMLQDDETDSNRRARLDVAINAILQGAALTRNMLAFARRAPLQEQVLDLNDILRGSKNWVGRTIPKSIAIETCFLAGLWKVKADESSTVSAFLNLVVNARDAMPDGGKITIETSNVRVDREYIDLRGEDIEHGRYVMVALSDTGTGIPAEDLNHIFEPFFTTKDPGDGTGLGLSTVQGFMKQSRGTIRVYSEVGVGTTIKLYFPAFFDDENEDDRLMEPPRAKATKGAKLLLVEDEPEILSVLCTALSLEGYTVEAAKSGDEAARIFESNRDFDLVVTDIVMPGELQGTTLSHHLRDIRPNLPMVFMSGYASEATVHGNGLRPQDIRLMKPVRKRDLVDAIEHALTK